MGNNFGVTGSDPNDFVAAKLAVVSWSPFVGTIYSSSYESPPRAGFFISALAALSIVRGRPPSVLRAWRDGVLSAHLGISRYSAEFLGKYGARSRSTPHSIYISGGDDF